MHTIVAIDTNVLQQLKLKGDAPEWYITLRSLCDAQQIEIVTAEICLLEWNKHIRDDIKATISKAKENLAYLSNFFDLSAAQIALSAANDDPSITLQFLRNRVSKIGLKVISTNAKDINDYVSDAVLKQPPFESGGKGFIDAIILDSFRNFASEHYDAARVIVLSNDRAVKQSRERLISSNFDGLVVDPENCYKYLSEENEKRAKNWISCREQLLLTHANSHKQEILGSLRTRQVTLPSTTSFGRDLEHYKVIRIEPVSFESVQVQWGVPEQVAGTDRIRFTLSVKYAVELVGRPTFLDGLNVFSAMSGPLVANPASTTPTNPATRTSRGGLSQLLIGDKQSSVIDDHVVIDVDASVVRSALNEGSIVDMRVEEPLSSEQVLSFVEYLRANQSKDTN